MGHEQPRLLPGNQPPIHHVLKLLPNYVGDSAKVQGFCQAIRNLRRLYGGESEYWIRNNVGKLLKGRAEVEFGSQVLEYNSLEELLIDFKTLKTISSPLRKCVYIRPICKPGDEKKISIFPHFSLFFFN